MKRKNPGLQDKYSKFTDEDLVSLVRLKRDQYTPEAIVIAEQELEKRGYEIEQLEVEADSMDAEPEGLFTDRIDHLVEDILESDEQEATKVKEAIENQYAETPVDELLERYAAVMDEVIAAKKFTGEGPNNTVDAFDALSKTIEKRQITLPEVLQKKHARVERIFNYTLAVPALKKSGRRNLIIGILVLAAGLIFTLDSGSTRVFFGAIIIGLIQIGRGIASFSQASALNRK